MESFEKWWNETGGVVQYCGKDNLQHQAVRWQAMLMSVGLTPSRQIVVDGFVTAEGGVKMSKSLGNVVNPVEIVSEYGTDALRYYVLRELSMFEDSPFSLDFFKKAYNTGLANGVGNLVSRVMKMATANGVVYGAMSSDQGYIGTDGSVVSLNLDSEVVVYVEKYELNRAMDIIWKKMTDLDTFIQEKAPFKLIKTDPETAKKDIAYLLAGLGWVAVNLSVFLPDTSAKIQKCLDRNMMPEVPLFLRKD
jgi:methionyl-tRNA synthetase